MSYNKLLRKSSNSQVSDDDINLIANRYLGIDTTTTDYNNLVVSSDEKLIDLCGDTHLLIINNLANTSNWPNQDPLATVSGTLDIKIIDGDTGNKGKNISSESTAARVGDKIKLICNLTDNDGSNNGWLVSNSTDFSTKFFFKK